MQHFILFIFFFNFRFNRAITSRSGAIVQERNFQSVIGPLTLEAALYFILFYFNFRFNRAIISRSSAMIRHINFQSVIASLNRGFKPLKQHFILFLIFLILDLIGIQSIVQVLWFDIEIFKV